MNTRDKGRLGENIAIKYLKNKRYKVVDKNFYTRFGEIDIIAYDKHSQELVFVEVKARNSIQFGYPEEAVDHWKFQKIIKTAQIYLDRHHIDKKYRFDCMAIDMDYHTRRAKIRHYENIS